MAARRASHSCLQNASTQLRFLLPTAFQAAVRASFQPGLCQTGACALRRTFTHDGPPTLVPPTGVPPLVRCLPAGALFRSVPPLAPPDHDPLIQTLETVVWSAEHCRLARMRRPASLSAERGGRRRHLVAGAQRLPPIARLLFPSAPVNIFRLGRAEAGRPPPRAPPTTLPRPETQLARCRPPAGEAIVQMAAPGCAGVSVQKSRTAPCLLWPMALSAPPCPFCRPPAAMTAFPASVQRRQAHRCSCTAILAAPAPPCPFGAAGATRLLSPLGSLLPLRVPLCRRPSVSTSAAQVASQPTAVAAAAAAPSTLAAPAPAPAPASSISAAALEGLSHLPHPSALHNGNLVHALQAALAGLQAAAAAPAGGAGREAAAAASPLLLGLLVSAAGLLLDFVAAGLGFATSGAVQGAAERWLNPPMRRRRCFGASAV